MSHAIDTVEETRQPSLVLEEDTCEDLMVRSLKIRHSGPNGSPFIAGSTRLLLLL